MVVRAIFEITQEKNGSETITKDSARLIMYV